MSIEVKVYDNSDHVCLVWCPLDRQPLASCQGFAIARKKNGSFVYLRNSVGFDPDNERGSQPSTVWPIQRFFWWDYDIALGDTVQYAVIPVGKPGDPSQFPQPDNAAFTPPLKVSGQPTKNISAFFNRGIIATQWVADALRKAEPDTAARTALLDLVQKPGNPLREALGGLLRTQILDLLKNVKLEGGSIFAALYELNDPELIEAIIDLGSAANVILANGAFTAQKPDESIAARKKLEETGTVKVYPRMVSKGHFAHNKFVVCCDASGAAQRVLTGSTNWTSTGLCTQANNGLIIDDPQVASAYLQEWGRLHSAGNGFPPSLVAANSQPKSFQVDSQPLSVWFAPTDHAEDLQQARQLINQAKQGILFLFFNPGVFEEDPDHWTLLQSVLNRHAEENNPFYNGQLYIRGVVNQEIPQLTEPVQAEPARRRPPAHHDFDPAAPTHPVVLFSGGQNPPQRLTHDVLVPRAIRQNYARWVPELLGASNVMIHSKVVVIDPFGDHPVVMTGSHNMGFKASSKNDDNFVIVENNPGLAAAYAVNIISIYQTYRWRNYLQHPPAPGRTWRGLETGDTWQQGHLQGEGLAELDFWLGRQSGSLPGEQLVSGVARVQAPPLPPVSAAANGQARSTASEMNENDRKRPAKKKLVKRAQSRSNGHLRKGSAHKKATRHTTKPTKKKRKAHAGTG